MAQRFIGIDLSTRAVRAFELVGSPRSVALGDYHEQPIPPPDDDLGSSPFDLNSERAPEDSAEATNPTAVTDDTSHPTWAARAGAALAALITRLPLRGADAVTVGLNAPAHVSAILTLPFNDPKVVAQVLPGELAELLPMDEEHITSFVGMGPAAEGGFHTLVVAAKPEELQGALGALEVASAEAQVASPITFTQHRLLRMIRPDLDDPDPAPYVIINIGARHTHLTIAQGDKFLQARTLLTGGDAITEALADALDLPYATAEDLKAARGFVAPHGQAQRWATSLGVTQGFSGGRLISSDAIAAAAAAALRPLMLGLRQLLASFTSRTKLRVARAWLTGNGARLRGLPELINHDLQLEASPLLPTPDPTSPLSELARGHGHAITTPLALALTARAFAQHEPLINLRQGRFAFRGGLDFLREHALSFTIIAACLIAAVAFTLFARFNALAAERDHLTKTLSQVTKDLFGAEALTPKAVQAQLDAVSGLRGFPERSAYYHLAAITTFLTEEFTYDPDTAPPDAPPPPNFEIRRFTINITTKDIMIEAAVSPNPALQKFKRALTTYSCLPPNIEELEQVNDTDIPGYTRVKFSFKIIACGAE